MSQVSELDRLLPAASTAAELLDRPLLDEGPATPAAGRPAAAAGRFAFVGLTGVVVNQVVLWALVDGLSLHYLVAAVLSAQVAIASNFVLTELWVFAGRRSGPVVARVAAFAVVSNSTLLLQIPLLGLLTTVAGLHYLLSNALSVALLFGLRFVLSDRLIWRSGGARRSASSARHVATGRGRVVAAGAEAWRQWASVRGRVERALRIPLAVAVVAGAYHYSLLTLVDGRDGLAGLGGGEAPLAYLGLVPFVGLLLLIAQATDISQEPDIHDRQVDYIVGLAFLALAFVVLFVVRSRLVAQFWLWRMDLASLPLFVAGVIVLLFGLRALWRVRAGVAFLLLAWPPVGRRLTELAAAALSAFHDHPTDVDGLVGFAIVAVALTLLVRGRLVAKVAWLAAGLLFAWLVQVLRLLELVAAGLPERLGGVLAIAAAAAVMWFAKRAFGLRGPRWRPDPTALPMATRRRWAVPRPGLALGVVLIAGMVAGVADARLSTFRAVAGDLGEARLAAFSPAAARVPGWSIERMGSFPIVTRYLGPDATWDRYSYQPKGQRGKARASLVADVTSTSNATALAAQEPGVIYGIRGESDQDRQVALGPGLIGRIEQRAPRTGRPGWTMVSWQWPVQAAHGQVRYERVNLVATTHAGSRPRAGADVGPLTVLARKLVQSRLAAADLRYRDA